MSKELEALENIKREAGIPYFSTLYDIDMWREDFKTVEKSLKALEIIKIVCPNIFWVMRTYTYKQYKKKCPDDTLLQQEYELLKEVLL